LDYSPGLSVNVKDWDKKRHLTRNNSYLNGQIADGLARVNEIGSKLAKEGKLTFDNLRTVLNDDETLNGIFGKDRKTRKSNYLPPFEFIENFIQRSVATDGTKKDYRNTLMHLKDFDKFRGKSLSWKSADYQYYLELVDYLKEKRLKGSTIDKVVKNLKVFLSQADLMDGIEVCQDFKKTVSGKSLFAKVSKEETDHVYLTESEIRQITNANMPDKRLAEIRDLFVIQCWTGLRISDLSRLELDNIKDGLLSITAKKTRQKVVIPVTDELQTVLNKYPDQLPKIPTDQHFNREIKKVAECAGINDNVMAEVKKGSLTVTAPVPKYKVITSHTGRRSFATNLYRRGIPSTQLMFLTGHRSENSFLKYIKVSKEDNAKDVAKKLKRIG
jgi:integrase